MLSKSKTVSSKAKQDIYPTKLIAFVQALGLGSDHFSGSDVTVKFSFMKVALG